MAVNRPKQKAIQEVEVIPTRKVLIRPGVPGDEAGYRALVARSGEGGVDVRSAAEIAYAIEGSRLIVIESDGQIVGGALYFVRNHGRHNRHKRVSVELGGLVLDEGFRGVGLAQLMAMCRLIMILPQWDNAPILAEVYLTSTTSLRYLTGLGFQAFDSVPFAMHDVAWKANEAKAVVYMVADPMTFQALMVRFAKTLQLRSAYGPKGSVEVEFHDDFGTLASHVHFAQKEQYLEDAFRNFDGIGFGKGLNRWLAKYFAAPNISRSAFLIEKGLDPASWGYDSVAVDRLALSFLQSLQGAATSK